MKNYFFFLFVLIVSSINAQNWNLLNKNYKYHYLSANRELATIYSDSFEVNGADTIFYLNRIVSYCDTCFPYCFGNPIPVLENQPQFLQRKATKSNDFYIFSDPLKFRINPYASLNETWTFDSTAGITATIGQTGTLFFLGVTDSIKIIRLSNNDLIIISKNYGIVSFSLQNTYFVDYHLVGINGAKIGIQIPEAKDYYDFNVGDVFQYKGGGNDGDGDYTYDFNKYTILEKTVYIDSVVYKVKDQWKRSTSYESHWSASETIYKWVFVFDELEPATKFNNEKIYFGKYLSGNDTIQKITIMRIDIDSYEIKYTKWNDVYLTCHHYKKIVYGGSDESRKLKFRPYLGNTNNHYFHFETSYSKDLIGYIRNGDTTGTVYDDRFMGVNDAQINAPTISVFPNPAQNFIKILIDNTEQTSSEIEISDPFGRVYFKGQINQSENTINLENFSKGFYFIKVCSGKSVYFSKLIVE